MFTKGLAQSKIPPRGNDARNDPNDGGGDGIRDRPGTGLVHAKGFASTLCRIAGRARPDFIHEFVAAGAAGRP